MRRQSETERITGFRLPVHRQPADAPLDGALRVAAAPPQPLPADKPSSKKCRLAPENVRVNAY
jgi:hypothetical protein